MIEYVSQSKIIKFASKQKQILNDASKQTKYAPIILNLFKNMLLPDKEYVNRIKKHYSLFKKEIDRKKCSKKMAGDKKMSVDEILKELSIYTGKFPRQAVQEAINKQEEIIPYLMKELETVSFNAKEMHNDGKESELFLYSIFLLAQFRDKKAFNTILKFIEHDKDIIEYFIGEDIAGSLPAILASTYDGNDKALFEIITSEKYSELVRISALSTFAVLYFNNAKTKEFIVNYFKKLLLGKDKKDIPIYTEITCISCDLCLKEMYPYIEKKYKEGLIDTDWISIQEIEDELNSELDSDIKSEWQYRYVTDAIKTLEWWACFNEEEPLLTTKEETTKIGRNELCICGSRQKI